MLICQKKDCVCSEHKLLFSIECRKYNETKLLLEDIKNPGLTVDDSGSTLLHYSVEHDNAEIVKYLIGKGFNVNSQDIHGSTPLMLAVEKHKAACLEVLLKNNAEIYIGSHSGRSHFDVAGLKCLSCFSSRKEDWQVIVEALFKKLNDDFLTGKFEATQLLLNANKWLKYVILIFGSEKVTRFVLDNGFSLDFKIPGMENTALHRAVMFGKLDDVKKLIKLGANVNAKNGSKHRPLYCYIGISEDEDETSDALRMLLRHSNHLTGVHEMRDFERLICCGKKRTVRIVLQSGIISKDAIFDCGKSLLHLLIENKNYDVLELLDELDMRYDVNARERNGRTALMTAAYNGYFRKIEFLLNRGADVNLISSRDDTALYFAATKGGVAYKEEAKMSVLLLRHGADAQVVIVNKRTIIGCLSWYCKPTFHIRELAIKVIIAHLAMLKTLDESSLTGLTRREIQYESILQDYFDLCMRQLAGMKMIKVYGDVTLFDFLIESEKQVLAYARNPEFRSAFRIIRKNILKLEFYYSTVLLERIPKATRIIKLNRKAAKAISLLTGLCDDIHYFIVHRIIEYLKPTDINNLQKVGKYCLEVTVYS